MTFQLSDTLGAGKSKSALSAALLANPAAVVILDPSLFSPRAGGRFSCAMLHPGEQITVVMDHPKRTRFSTITRLPKGAGFRVE